MLVVKASNLCCTIGICCKKDLLLLKWRLYKFTLTLNCSLHPNETILLSYYCILSHTYTCTWRGVKYHLSANVHAVEVSNNTSKVYCHCIIDV